MLTKNDFSLLFFKIVSYKGSDIMLLQDKFKRLKFVSNRFLFFFTLTIYSIIVHGYYKAHYPQLMYLTFVSMFITIILFGSTFNHRSNENLNALLYIYIPVFNVIIKDVFFMEHKYPAIGTVFLHTQFMLSIFIAFSGIIVHQRHAIILGCISIIWIWIFTIYMNNNFIWSLIVLNSTFFAGTSILVYFACGCVQHIAEEFDILVQVVNSQNKELTNLMSFKDNMLNMIVHDIKNPLNKILTASQKCPIQKEDINKPSKNILLIVENILDTYKMTETQMKLKLSLCNFTNMLEDALFQINYLLDEKNLTINKRIYINAIIDGDKNLLERVIVNLLTNAIKHSEINGCIDIHLLDKEDKLRLEIINHGETIEYENIKSIFSKYRQINAQELKYVRSTGIGLYFCKLAIETHGGHIGVESNTDRGTNFWFELPTAPDKELVFEETVHNLKQDYEYSNLERKILLQCKQEIACMEVYQVSEIIKALNSIGQEGSEALLSWKEEVMNAAITGNQEYFDRLRSF